MSNPNPQLPATKKRGRPRKYPAPPPPQAVEVLKIAQIQDLIIATKPGLDYYKNMAERILSIVEDEI